MHDYTHNFFCFASIDCIRGMWSIIIYIEYWLTVSAITKCIPPKQKWIPHGVGCSISIQSYMLGNNNIASRPITRPTCTLCHMACMWPLLHVSDTIGWTSFFIWQMHTSYRRTLGKWKILTHNPMRKDNTIQSEHTILHYVQCYIIVQRWKSLYSHGVNSHMKPSLNENYFHWNPSSNTPLVQYEYRSTIAGSCKKNSQRKDPIFLEIMNPIKRISESLH